MKHKIRAIRIVGNIAYVPLTQGYEAIIDANDAHLVGQYNWQVKHCLNTKYASRVVCIGGGKTTSQSMHRLIAKPSDAEIIDHINSNGLDNRRANLRRATSQQNQFNRRNFTKSFSGIRGVDYMKSMSKWRARITIDGKCEFLGIFDTKEEAKLAYQSAAKQMHGDFARLD